MEIHNLEGRFFFFFSYLFIFCLTYLNSSSIIKFVIACSLFVSGHWRKKPAVVPWQTKPLRMSDLAHIKLIGLSKQAPIPRAVEVCILPFF